MIDQFRLLDKLGFSFDIETTGLDANSNNTVSMAISEYGAKAPYEKFMFKKTSEAPFYGLPENTSLFSLDSWKAIDANVINSNYMSFPDYLNKLSSTLDERPFMVGHNLGFDLNFISKEFNRNYINDKSARDAFVNIQKKFNPYGINIDTTPEDLVKEYGLSPETAEKILYKTDANGIIDKAAGMKYGIKSHISNVKKNLDDGDPERALKAFRQAMVDVSKSGVDGIYTKATTVDTFTMAKIAHKYMEKAGKVTYAGAEIPITGNGIIGARLENLATVIGVKDIEEMAHTGMDTVFNQPVEKALTELIGGMQDLKPGGTLDLGTLSPNARAIGAYFSALSDVDETAGLAHAANTREHLDNASNLINAIMDGKVVKGVTGSQLRTKALDLNLENQINSMIIKSIDELEPNAKEGMGFADLKFKFRDGKAVSRDSLGKAIHEVYPEYSKQTIQETVDDIMFDSGLNQMMFGKDGDSAKFRQIFTERNDVISKTLKRYYSGVAEAISTSIGTDTEPFIKISKFGAGTKRMAIGAGIAIAGATFYSMLSHSNEDYDQEIKPDEYYNFMSQGAFGGINIEPVMQNYESALDPGVKNYYINRLLKKPDPIGGIGLEMSKHLTNHYFM